MSDRERIGVLFQGACANAHFEAIGLAVEDWARGHLSSDGVLNGLVVAPLDENRLPQEDLLGLMRALFPGEEPPAGRGEGQRIARALFSRWRQEVAPVSLATEVEELLHEAGFLWRAEFGSMRVALALELPVNGGSELRVLGPVHFARVMLAGELDWSELAGRLSAAAAGATWMSSGRHGQSPRDLMKAGQWRAAVRSWRQAKPETIDDRIDCARCLYSIGRFEDAIASLKGLRRSSARILRLWCQYRLNRLGSALRGLRGVDREALTTRQRVQLLAVALRVLENQGEAARADRWLAEGLVEADEWARIRVEILAATNAWDRSDQPRMQRHLERAKKAMDSENLGPRDRADLLWRWNKAAGLERLAAGDGVGAVARFSDALRVARRGLTPFEAGLLWNELALGRAGGGDLGGAERALLHLNWLHREAQGSRTTTSTLFNLAEIRIRRGRLAGVREILEAATLEDRRSRNWRSLAHDMEVWVRYELALGRPHAGLLRARDALVELEERGIRWQLDLLHQLAARALGWLGRPEAAADELEVISGPGVHDLEAEEIPALWALAGDRERALAEVGDGPLAPLWTLILTGSEIEKDEWSALDLIEPFRAGRFVFDCEMMAPGTVPPPVLRQAVVSLRDAGAGPLAERLDSRDSSTWKALNEYLADRRSNVSAIERLLADAGYPEARVFVRRRGRDTVLCNGRGGEARFLRPVAGGEVVLEAPYVDEAQKALTILIADSIEPEDLDPVRRRGPRRSLAGIVGESPALLDVLERVARLAPAGVPIVILGESGTGKELLAKEVHARSGRPEGPYVTFNSAATSRDLLTSLLFGHVRGSFTGATGDRPGIFETANRGTVFLDEIGDLPLEAQGFLLRVLQEGEVVRVGDTLPRKVDVRVVSATNRDLGAMAREGTFRNDLFYRLRAATLMLPPLRDRGDDISLLANFFLRRLAPERSFHLSPEARAQLHGHDWPGNIRELENSLRVAVAYADGDEIRPEHLELPYRSAAPKIGYDQKVLNYRRKLLSEALRATGGNQAEAARRVGTSRQNMSTWVKKLELDR